MLLRRNYCAVFSALFVFWFFVGHADASDWGPNHHLVEVDNCHKINLDQNTGTIVFTAICKPMVRIGSSKSGHQANQHTSLMRG